MRRRVLVVDRAHDREPGLEDLLLPLPVERQPQRVELDDRVEVAAEREAVRHGAVPRHLDGGIEPLHVRRHVLDRDGRGPTVLHVDARDHEARRGVEPDRGDRLLHLDEPRLHQHGRDADGAVTAHREAAGHLDVQDAPVAVVARGRLQDRAAHRRVPARLRHEQEPQVVEVLDEVQAALVHGGAGDHAEAARDDAGRHALRVRVDGVEDAGGPHASIIARRGGRARGACRA